MVCHASSEVGFRPILMLNPIESERLTMLCGLRERTSDRRHRQPRDRTLRLQ
jgi:hypothetical protein